MPCKRRSFSGGCCIGFGAVRASTRRVQRHVTAAMVVTAVLVAGVVWDTNAFVSI